MVTENYTGWRRWKPTNDEWIDFYTNQKVPFEVLENEYLILEGDDTTTYYCYENGKFRHCTGRSIATISEDPNDITEPVSKKSKKFSRGKKLVITPKNDEQVCCIDLLKDPSKTVKTVLGVWGSGKDFLMANAALEALSLGQYEKIVWLRNNVRIKDTPDLGALPGGTQDKLIPFLGPFVDAVGEHTVKTMLDKGTLQIEPLQSLRGRNFANSIIICSEAENLSYEHLKLIVARVAEGSCLYINGDLRQRDLATFERAQGLEKFIACLAGDPLFGYVYLPKTERSATAQLADKLDKFEFTAK